MHFDLVLTCLGRQRCQWWWGRLVSSASWSLAAGSRVTLTCSSWKMGSSTSSLVSPASSRGQHGVSEDLRLSIRM